jgi:hypothetical protein
MDLLKIRTTEKAFHPLGKQTIFTISPSIFAIQRQSLDKLDHIMAVHNVTDKIISCDLPIVGIWRDLHSDLVWDRSNQFNLEPYQICWLKRDM